MITLTSIKLPFMQFTLKSVCEVERTEDTRLAVSLVQAEKASSSDSTLIFKHRDPRIYT